MLFHQRLPLDKGRRAALPRAFFAICRLVLNENFKRIGLLNSCVVYDLAAPHLTLMKSVVEECTVLSEAGMAPQGLPWSDSRTYTPSIRNVILTV